MSLTKCIKRLGIPEHEETVLRALYDKLRTEDLDAVKAAQEAVRIRIEEHGRERAGIIEEAHRRFPQAAARENNASGESPASLEAINRAGAEKAAGQGRWKIRRSGEVVPVLGVDGPDARAYRGEIIVQRGVGKDDLTVLDADPSMGKGERNRLIAGLRRQLREDATSEKKRAERERPISLNEWIARRGGLASSEKLDTVGDTAIDRRTGVDQFGVGRWLFRPDGEGVDELARAAHEAGFLTDDEFNDVDGGVQALKDKIADEYGGGRKHYSMDDARYEAELRRADDAKARALEEDLNERANEAVAYWQEHGELPAGLPKTVRARAEDALERIAIQADPPRDADADAFIPFDEQRDSPAELPDFAREVLDAETDLQAGRAPAAPDSREGARPEAAARPAEGPADAAGGRGEVEGRGREMEPPRPTAERADDLPGREGRGGEPRRERPDLELAGESDAELKASAAKARAEATATAKREAAPPPEDFRLEGSDRPVDKARARGQSELFTEGEGPGPGTLFSNPIGPMVRPIVNAVRDALSNLDTPEARELRRSFFDFDRGAEKHPGNPIANFVRLVGWSDASVVDSVARMAKSKVLERVARMFSEAVATRMSGKDAQEAVGETYEAEVRAHGQRRANAVAKALDSMPEDAWPQLVRLLENRGQIKGDTPLHRAARTLADLLDGELARLREAGVDVGTVTNYFPRVYDTAAILRTAALPAFRAAAQKAYRAVGLSPEVAAEAADAWVMAMRSRADNIPDVPFLTLGQDAPQKAFAKHREFTPEIIRSSGLDKFLVRDPMVVLPEYFHRTARRAAFERRFGRFTPEEVKARALELRRSGDRKGADDFEARARDGEYTRWKEMRRELEAEGNGHLIEWAEQKISAMMGNVGTTSAKWREAASLIRAITVATFLRRAVISSLTEPMQAANRVAAQGVDTGLLAAARMYWDGFKDLSDFYLGRQPDADRADAYRAAELIGAIMNDHLQANVMAHRFDHADIYQGRGWMGRNAERLSVAAMKASGLHTWTVANRVNSVKIGRAFLRAMAEDATGSKSKLALYELARVGISEAQAKAFADYARKDGSLRDLERIVADAAAGKEGAQLYLNALNRFTDQVIMDPKAADKPYLAKHPFAGLAYNLQSWLYSFWYNVQKPNLAQARRALTEAGFTSGERVKMLAGPAIQTAMTYLLVSSLTNTIRDYFSGKAKNKQFRESQDAEVLGMKVSTIRDLSQAQLFGLLDPFVNVATGARYGRAPEAALAGAALSRGTVAMREGVLALSDRNTKGSNLQERRLAGAVYDLAVDPAIAIGTSMMPGARFLTPIGQRDEFKQSFVDATAGPRRPKARGGGEGGY